MIPESTPKSNIDAFGAGSLIFFALLLAFNQVVIKLTNEGLQPVFFAALRSFGAVACVRVWMWVRGIRRDFRTASAAGVLIGVVFAFEFLFMFIALDLTSVARSSVIFYSMPLWLALGAHFILGERLFLRKSIGLLLAFAGVSVAILSSQSGQGGSLIGDLCALAAAWFWAGIALIARGSALRSVKPEMQLLWQVAVSAPVLLGMSVFFGPFLREFEPIHLAGLAFQVIVIVSAGYMFWLWLLTIYPASSVAAFSFLSPVFGVALGWLLLDEPVGPILLVALVLVAVGIVLINIPRRA